MLRFIRDKTGAPYFSNLTWFIAQHVRYIDQCVRSDVKLVINTGYSNIVVSIKVIYSLKILSRISLNYSKRMCF